MRAARNIFYSIYGGGERSKIIDDILQHLDFHALSITLLATTASNNMWSYDRLAKEWDKRRTRVLQMDQNESLAATVELSLASRTFRKLGPNARDLLGVVAFFPQGIDEKNLYWLFPAISHRKDVFDKFCVLSLTFRNHGFITMLAPIRDYFCPQNPKSSPLLCATKDHYFTRLSVGLDPHDPKFGESRWIVSEDVNIEHLLDTFISIDMNAPDIWDACVHFIRHLHWQQPRYTILRSKIEGLPDGHPSKAEGLFWLSRLFVTVGNHAQAKQYLIYTLELYRAGWDNSHIARTLVSLSCTNRYLGFLREGIQQAEEALTMYTQLGNTTGQVACLDSLAELLLGDNQLDAAEGVVFRKIDLLPEENQQFPENGRRFELCRSHRSLGDIYCSKGEKEKAISHYKIAVSIASPCDWQTELFGVYYSMAKLFYHDHEFCDANAYIKQAKSHTADSAYNLGWAMRLQAQIWCQQHRLGDAKSEALGALELYERLGAAEDAKLCRELLRWIEEARRSRKSGKSDSIN